MYAEIRKEEPKKPTAAVYLTDINGNYYGKFNDQRLKAAKWYQRLFAFFSRKYKRKFIDLDPIPVEEIDFNKEIYFDDFDTLAN